MAIAFTNPGVLDIRLATTLGTNVKDGDSPIGFFGTGLKYAISVLLRNEQKISIYCGEVVYNFFTEEKIIRNKLFQFIVMESSLGETATLGFTTELGKNWSIDNALRELYANCLDEQGWVQEVSRIDFGLSDFTHVYVEGELVEQRWQNRHEFILPKKQPIFTDPAGKFEIYEGASTQIFYHGFAAGKLPKPAEYTYNLLGSWRLTEDRVIEYYWLMRAVVSETLLMRCEDQNIIDTLLTANDSTFESSLDFAQKEISKIVASAVQKQLKTSIQVSRAVSTIANTNPKQVGVLAIKYAAAELSASEEMLVTHAVQLVNKLVRIARDAIVVTDELPDDCLGKVVDSDVYISTECLSSKQRLVATILEEAIHKTYQVADYSREMQEVFLRLLTEAAIHGLPKD